jgi:hypothetical protein
MSAGADRAGQRLPQRWTTSSLEVTAQERAVNRDRAGRERRDVTSLVGHCAALPRISSS